MEKRIQYNKYDAGLGFLSAIFLPAMVAFLYMILAIFIASLCKIDSDTLKDNTVYLYISLFLTPLAFLLTFIFVNRVNKVNWKTATGIKNKINFVNVIVCILISFVCVFFVMNFVNLFDALVSLTGFKGNYDLPLPIDSIWWLLLNLIVMALLPAICEELVFRGIIFNGLKDYGKIKAVFFSALLFMLMHGGIEQTVYPFIVGVVLGFIMLKTNNIVYPIITHFFNNAIVLVYNYIMTAKGSMVVEYAFSAYNIIFAIVSLISAILVVWVIVKFLLKRNKTNDEVVCNVEKKSNALLYIAIACSIIIWIFDLISGFSA